MAYRNVAFSLLLTLCVGGALAADESKGPAAKKKDGPSVFDSRLPRTDLPNFKALDTDNDKFISRTEAAARPQLEEQFDRADLNKDGKLDRKEYRELGRLLRLQK